MEGRTPSDIQLPSRHELPISSLAAADPATQILPAKDVPQSLPAAEEEASDSTGPEDQEYDVNQIVGAYTYKSTTYYRVNWDKYPSDEDTWEPEVCAHCRVCDTCVPD